MLGRGFQDGWQPHWMGVELRALPAGGARGRAGRPAVRGAPVRRTRLPPGRGGARRPRAAASRWATRGCSSDDGIAGIYDVGVVPERARRRGIGRVLTLALCRPRAQRGCTHAVLNATWRGRTALPVARVRVGRASAARGGGSARLIPSYSRRGGSSELLTRAGAVRGRRVAPPEDDPDERQRQLTRLGNAANAAALSLLMLGRATRRAAGSTAPRGAGARASSTRRRTAGGGRSGRSRRGSSPATWAGAAEDEARWALELGAPRRSRRSAATPATLALLALGRGRRRGPSELAARRRRVPAGRRARRCGCSPRATTRSATSRRSRACSARSRRATSTSRTSPVADTVLVLQALAARRDLGGRARVAAPAPA